MGGRLSRVGLRLAAGATLVFLYVPIFIIAVYAFNDSKNQSWTSLLDRLGLNGFFQTFSFRWFEAAWKNDQVRESLWLSLQAAFGAMLVALILGSAAAFAVHRHRFFGLNVTLVVRSKVGVGEISVVGFVTDGKRRRRRR